jgi:hypothetical protein
MKKVYAAFSIVFAIGRTMAQSPISVNQSDFANANTFVILSNEGITSITNNDLSTVGPNNTWNFSGFTANSQDTLTFSSPGSTGYLLLNNSFVSTYANKGVFALPAIPNFPTVSDVTDFYKKSSTDLRQVGLGVTLAAIPIPTFYNPVDKIYKFPLNYNNVDSGTSKFSISIPTLGYYGANMKRKNEVDAWGSLTTPYGTFQTLRIKSTVERIDSLKLDTLLPFGFSFPRPTLIEYKWVAKTQKYPVMQVNTNIIAGTEVITSIQYQDSARILGISKIAASPASAISLLNHKNGNYTVKRNINGKSDIYLFDITGKMIWQNRWLDLDFDITLPQENSNYVLVIATDNDVKAFKLNKN